MDQSFRFSSRLEYELELYELIKDKSDENEYEELMEEYLDACEKMGWDAPVEMV